MKSYILICFLSLLLLTDKMGCNKKYEPIFVTDPNNKSQPIVLVNDTIGYLVKDVKEKYIYLVNQNDTLSIVCINSLDWFEYNTDLNSNKKSISESDSSDYKNRIFFTLYNFKHSLDKIESFDLKMKCSVESHNEKIDLVKARFWPFLKNNSERDIKIFEELKSNQLYNPDVSGSNPNERIADIEFTSKHFIDLNNISYSISLKYSTGDSIKYFSKTDTLYRVFIVKDILISN